MKDDTLEKVVAAARLGVNVELVESTLLHTYDNTHARWIVVRVGGAHIDVVTASDAAALRTAIERINWPRCYECDAAIQPGKLVVTYHERILGEGHTKMVCCECAPLENQIINDIAKAISADADEMFKT